MTQTIRTIPLRTIAPVFLRDPLAAVERIGAESGGEVVRINLGGVRPLLVTRPDDLQQVLIRNKGNYVREGWLWRPLSRLIGDPSGADELWWTKREVFARLVSGPSIRDFADEMAATISTAVAEMAARGRDGRALDAGEEMARIVYRAITRVLIGNKITDEQADRLGAALRTTSASMRPRLMFPFVPNAVPFAGDRRFRRSVAGIDEMVFPIVDRARRRGPDGRDIVSRLLEARTSDGRGFTRQELRDGMVSLFVAGTETTTIAMTFLWTVLDRYPQVAQALKDEVDRVVGPGPLNGSHLADLTYARNVALEMLRLYPPGWMLPRKVVDDDVIGGAPVTAGGLIVMSPYLTNRLPELWDRPEEFDPSRHDRGVQQPTFSYLTFGGGPHACVGKPFFLAEVQLIIAAVLSTLHVTVLGAPSARPQLGLTLRPRERTMLRLIPRTATGGDGRVSGDG